MARMKGKQVLIEMLRAEGVKYVFGNPGTPETPLLDAIQDYPDIQYVVALQEASAIGMAEGYARYTGRPSFASVHISVGFANALSGLYSAYRGGSPVVLTAGQSDTRHILHEPTLWSDMKELGRHYTKWSAEVPHAENVESIVRRAFKVAKTPPTGPVFLAFPWNSMDEEVEADIVPSSQAYTRLRPDPDGLAKAVSLLAEARNPLMLVGDRVAQAQAVDEAVRVAELLGAPVQALTYYSEVDFPWTHPQFLGMMAASWPTRSLKERLNSYDVIFVVGCNFITQTNYAPEPLLEADGPKVVHMDSSAWEIEKCYATAVGLLCDPKAGLAELAGALESEMPRAAKETAERRAASLAQVTKQRREAFRERVRDTWDNAPISVERLMAEIAEVMPANTILADESITSKGALMQAVEPQNPGDYFGSRGGGLGWGMPAPLGIKLACPDRPVVAVVGDGAAMYTIQALWTAARYNIPVTYVICNNRSYKILKQAMLHYLAGTGRESDFVGLSFYEKPVEVWRIAESFDLLGIKVERPEDLRPALEKAFDAHKAAVVDVHIEETLDARSIQEEWLAWWED